MATICANSIEELTPGHGCDIDGAVFYPDKLAVDTLSEVTADHGVTINGTSFLDGALAATNELYIDQQLEAPPTEISSGGMLWVDNGDNSTAGDIWATTNSGSATATYCVLAQTPSYQALYAGADVNATQNQLLASVTLVPGTYLMSYSLLFKGSAAVTFFARIESTASGDIYPQSRSHAYQGANGASYPCGATCIITLAAADTLSLLVRGNTHSGDKIIDMMTTSINSVTQNVNNPLLMAWRIA